jgi:hypothetical protein
VDYAFFNALENTVRSGYMDAGRQRLLKSIDQLTKFISLVDSYGIDRSEPFYGVNAGPIQVLGPSVEFYESLLPSFHRLSEFVSNESTLEERLASEEYLVDLSEPLRKFAETERACPTVDENNNSSAENESSAVREITVDERRYLFTGDAGVTAFHDVQTRADLRNIYWLDVPHHGSRRSMTSDLISTMSPHLAYASAKGDSGFAPFARTVFL